MGKVLKFSSKKERRSFQKTLTDFMKEASKSEKEKSIPLRGGLYLSDFQELEEMIKKSISSILMNAQCTNSDYFLCGIYISKMVAKTAENPPESFYAIDHLKKIDSMEDYWNWQAAGDVSFLSCAFFPERFNHGFMTYKDCVSIGVGSYANFYSKSLKEIGYLMSIHYEKMAEITRKALLSPF